MGIEKGKQLIVVRPPLFKDRSRKTNSRAVIPEYDPYEMNPEIFDLISKQIKLQGSISLNQMRYFVNKLIPGKKDLFNHYMRFKAIRGKIEKIEEKQKLLDQLFEIIDDMEEHTNFGLSVVKRKKPKERKGENPYKKWFDFLDEKIEVIENLIYLCVSPKKICLHLLSEYGRDCNGLTPIIYSHWKDETLHIDRLKFAYKASGEEHMNTSKEFMLSWLNNPKLDMQHGSIVREIGLWHSRMAAYMDNKWNQKVIIEDTRPTQNFIAGADLDKFLEGIQDAAEKINNPTERREEDEDVEEEIGREVRDEDSSFTDYEDLTEKL